MSNSIKITQAVSWLMDVDPVATGKRLCKQRKALNLSQKKLSALFDEGGRSASITAISRWENGHDVPTISNLAFLVCLYHVSFDDLIVTFMQSHGGDGDDDGQAVSFYTLYCWIVLERMVIMTKDTVINTIRDILNKAGMEDIVSVSENMNEIADIMIYQKADEPVKTEYFAVHEVPLFPIDEMQNILYQYGSEKPYIYVGTELQILIELGNNARYVLEFGDDGISELMFFEGKWVDNREASLARYNHNTSKKRFIMELIYSVAEITEAGDSVEDTEIKEIKKTIDQYIKENPSDIDFLLSYAYESLLMFAYQDEDFFDIKDIISRIIQNGSQDDFTGYIRTMACDHKSYKDNGYYLTLVTTALQLIRECKEV